MSRDRDASFGRLSRGVSCSYLASCCKQLITSLIIEFVNVCMYVHATVYLCVHVYGYLYMLHGKGALIFVGWFVLLLPFIWCILFGYICMFLFLHACVFNIHSCLQSIYTSLYAHIPYTFTHTNTHNMQVEHAG